MEQPQRQRDGQSMAATATSEERFNSLQPCQNKQDSSAPRQQQQWQPHTGTGTAGCTRLRHEQHTPGFVQEVGLDEIVHGVVPLILHKATSKPVALTC